MQKKWEALRRRLELTGREQALRQAGGGVRRLVVRLLMYGLLISVSFVLLYPLFYSVSTAFRLPEDMHDPNVVWIPTTVTVENVVTIWTKLDVPRLLLNSLLLCGGSAVLQVLVCAVTGYGFARFQFKEKALWTVILVFTVILPPQIASIPNFFLYKNFDVFGVLTLAGNLTNLEFEVRLLDTPAVYFLPAVFGQGLRSGLFILIFRQFFRGLPAELEDSSYVDGAGPIRTFLRVMAPNCRPAIVVVFLFTLVWYWNDTYFGTMYMEELQTLSVRLSQIAADVSLIVPNYVGDPTLGVPLVQAGVLLSITPLLLLYLLCQRVFVESVERVGIVG